MSQAAVVTVALLPETKPGLDSRREERFPCDPRPLVPLLARPGLESFTALVLNVSARGLGLLTRRRLPVGTVLGLGLPGAGSAGPVRSARVAHCTPRGAGTWVVGCRLALPLTPSELTSLRSDEPPPALPSSPPTAAEIPRR